MRQWIEDTMAAAGELREAYIRVLLTRGVGDLSYDLKATPKPSLVIIVKPQVDPPPEARRAFDEYFAMAAEAMRNRD